MLSLNNVSRTLIYSGFLFFLSGWVFVHSGYSRNLKAYPQTVRLNHAKDSQRVVVLETLPDGINVDLSTSTTTSFSPEGIAVYSDGLITPISDGGTILTYEVGGATVTQTVEVSNSGVIPAISFRNDVEPVLMRSGCNSGACHGSARGKNGFKLSLFSEDPALDYIHLTRQVRGRRLDVSRPEESLMLRKPTAQVDHEGGTRFSMEDPRYETLLRWIQEGANDDPPDVRSLLSLQVLPNNLVLEGSGTAARIIVQAEYSDGTSRDVTDLALLSSSDDTVLKVDETGRVSAGQAGEAYVLARFGSLAVISQAIVLDGEEEFVWPETPSRNYVDDHIFAKLKKLRIAPAGVCSDSVFIRRAYLDILGVLPTVEETRSFLSDTDPDKRGKLIDALLEKPEFPELWAMKWADLLQVRTTNDLDRKAMHRYNDWLRKSFSENKPIDWMVRGLLTAEGGNFTQPAANFYVVASEPNVLAENVSQVFLGIQIKCAQCHNHPFEQWTMDDYYSFAAFFSQVGRKNSGDPRELVLFNRGSGEVPHFRDGRTMPPKFLGGEMAQVEGRDRRDALAEWLTAAENPWFSKNIANRVWAHFFGTGIVDPVDDFRATNPPSHPDLLEQLAARLVETGYDLRAVVRDICNSHTYQQTTRPEDGERGDARNFSHVSVRRLPAEQLLDAISSVASVKIKFSNLPLGARAVQIADGDSGNYFLETFGRPPRESVCVCERRSEPTLGQTLHLINGDTVQNAIQSPEGRLASLVPSTTDETAVIDELYLAAFSRTPTESETAKLVEYVAAAEDRKTVYEDLLWGILNSKEFLFNH